MDTSATIIVPVFQAEDYLQELIQALQRQSFASFECLLVDDGSMDSSAVISEEAALQDYRFSCIRQKNSGVSHTRNIGIQLACGEFLLFSDADDLPDAQWVESLVKCAWEKGANLAIGGFIREQGLDKIEIKSPSIGVMNELDKIIEQLVLPMCVWGFVPQGRRLPPVYGSVWRSAYQKCFLRQKGIIFPEGVTLGEDLLFNLQFFLCQPCIAFADGCHYLYRENLASATHHVDVLKRWGKYLALWTRVHQMLEKADVGKENLRWHNYQLGRYLINTLIETICPMQTDNNEKVSLWKQLLEEDAWNQASKALPQGLVWRRRLASMMLKPMFAHVTLFLYQWQISRKETR